MLLQQCFSTSSRFLSHRNCEHRIAFRLLVKSILFSSHIHHILNPSFIIPEPKVLIRSLLHQSHKPHIPYKPVPCNLSGTWRHRMDSSHFDFHYRSVYTRQRRCRSPRIDRTRCLFGRLIRIVQLEVWSFWPSVLLVDFNICAMNCTYLIKKFGGSSIR